MELGGVSVYLSEIATPGHKGFYVSWQSGSQQIAVMFAASVGVVLNSILPPEKMEQWGWRVPLLLGCVIVPFLFRLRTSLRETDEFVARKHHPGTFGDPPIPGQQLGDRAGRHADGDHDTVSFYMITAYTPRSATPCWHLSSADSLIVTLCVGASNLFGSPLWARSPTESVRRPLLFGCTLLMLFTAYPAMLWLVHDPSFARLLTIELWLSFIYGSYKRRHGCVPYRNHGPWKCEPPASRLAYSLATAIFGASRPPSAPT